MMLKLSTLQDEQLENLYEQGVHKVPLRKYLLWQPKQVVELQELQPVSTLSHETH